MTPAELIARLEAGTVTPEILAEAARTMRDAEEIGRKSGFAKAADWCADEAENCEDAARWGGSRAYVANCKAAAYALNNAARTIRAIAGGDQ